MNVRKAQLRGFWLTVMFLPLMISGCAFWHTHVVSPPPEYTLHRTPSIQFRLDPTNWVHTGNSVLATNLNDWFQNYTNSLGHMLPWTPDRALLAETFTNVYPQFGFNPANGNDSAYLNTVSNRAFEFLAGEFPNSGLMQAGQNAQTNRIDLMKHVGEMLRLTDEENRNLFTDHLGWIHKSWFVISSFKILSLFDPKPPEMTSPDLPVGVSVTPSWDENPGIPAPDSSSPSSDTGKTNQFRVSLGQWAMTFEGPSNTNQNSSTPAAGTNAASTGNRIPDFQEDQTVNLSISTVLNSASTLDRIDSVSTYVYLYPWPMALNGMVVPEREFWLRFFNRNTVQDPLVRTNTELLDNEFAEALTYLRVKVHDLSTLVDLGQVNLGTVQQTFGNSTAASITSLPLGGLTPQLSSTQTAGASASNTPLQQIDQRSTFIDPEGDFFRIDQRGLQSLDLAGRFNEKVTLHIPMAEDQNPPLTVLSPPKNTNELCELLPLQRPIYNAVDALTFSVVVAHQTTLLSADTEDRYGLNDRNNATLIVGVTPIQHMKLWLWERKLAQVSSLDIFGQTRPDHPARFLYLTTFANEKPCLLFTSGTFTDTQNRRLMDAIRAAAGHVTAPDVNPANWVDSTNISLVALTNNFVKIKHGEGWLTIGYADNPDDPRALVPITPP